MKYFIFEQDLLSGFSKYTKNLFERFYRKAFPERGHSSIYGDLEMIKLGFDTLWCIEQFYGDSTYNGVPKVLKELRNYNAIRKVEDINQLTIRTWGDIYRQLLVKRCKITQPTDTQYIQELKDRDANFAEEDIIWIDKVTKPSGKKMIIWLELGRHNYRTNEGNGLIHFFHKHTKKQFEHWGWDLPEVQARKILEKISQQNPIDIQYEKKKGFSYIYELRIKNGINRYILLGIGDNGFIKTVRPYTFE
jgi:hypothetical protein